MLIQVTAPRQGANCNSSNVATVLISQGFWYFNFFGLATLTKLQPLENPLPSHLFRKRKFSVVLFLVPR